MDLRTYTPLASRLVRDGLKRGSDGLQAGMLFALEEVAARPMGGKDEPPIAQAAEEQTASNAGIESPGRTAAPAVNAAKEVRPRGSLKLIVCNDGRGPNPHAANRGFARPGSRPSLCMVGGMDHAASTVILSATTRPLR
jgi:hypothetical protein